MSWIPYLLTGGFLKGYRTYIIAGVLVIDAVAKFATGDMSLPELMNNLPQLLAAGGLLTAAKH